LGELPISILVTLIAISSFNLYKKCYGAGVATTIKANSDSMFSIYQMLCKCVSYLTPTGGYFITNL
jgi:hypothetical protein